MRHRIVGAELLCDVFPRGVLADGIDRDAVTSAVDDENDRSALSDGRVVRHEHGLGRPSASAAGIRAAAVDSATARHIQLVGYG